MLKIWKSSTLKKIATSKATFVKDEILKSLKENWYLVKTSFIKEKLPEIKEILLSMWIANIFNNWEVWELTTEWHELVDKNLKNSYIKLWDILRRICYDFYTREWLEYDLYEKRWVHIRDENITKLLLYEINKARLDPAVIILPNEYKPYNPFIALIDYDEVFPELRQILSLYANLDEF